MGFLRLGVGHGFVMGMGGGVVVDFEGGGGEGGC